MAANDGGMATVPDQYARRGAFLRRRAGGAVDVVDHSGAGPCSMPERLELLTAGFGRPPLALTLTTRDGRMIRGLGS
jgi:hypothetical protein